MNIAQLTVNQNLQWSAPSLASAVAQSVDNFRTLLIMNQIQLTLAPKGRRRWTVTAVMERILDRLTWYHFLTPTDSVDPAHSALPRRRGLGIETSSWPRGPVRGRIVPGPAAKRTKPLDQVASGRWDVLIP